jgi:hypothetical protein
MSSKPDATLQDRVLGALDEAGRSAAQLAQAGREYLATEQGKEVRRRMATALMIAAPILGELPVLRRTSVGRVLRFAGVSALVIKGAEWLRDWEPQESPARA